jgi:hypothetical protein
MQAEFQEYPVIHIQYGEYCIHTFQYSSCMSLQKSINNFEFMLHHFQFTQMFLTRYGRTGKLCPFKCIPTLSERENSVSYIMMFLKFSVFITTDLLFILLGLNASVCLKVCLKFTSN